jgi:glycogen(starch) synthase
VTAVSSYLQHRLTEFLHRQDSAIPVTPMPVDDTFAGITDRTASSAKKQYMVLGVGRLSQQKSFHDLIAATALIRQRGVDVNTLIIGDGVEEETLRELAGRLGLHDQVQLLGSKTTLELVEYYRACDAVALPSHDEGLGLTLVEAMLCGAPAIGAQSGGITDVIVDNETGLLFPPGDVPALADALQRILTDEKLAGRLSTAGQSFARRQYDPALCIDKMLNVYKSVLARSRPAA